MAGTRLGGLKAAATNKRKNPNHYSDIGREGGQARVPKGFALNHELASTAGRIGGLKSRRNKPVDLTTTSSTTSTQKMTLSKPSSNESKQSAESEIHHPWRRTLWSAIRRKI